MALDWKWYTKFYPDLTKAGINTESKAIQHWTTYGQREKRYPNPHSVNNLTPHIIHKIKPNIPTISTIPTKGCCHGAK